MAAAERREPRGADHQFAKQAVIGLVVACAFLVGYVFLVGVVTYLNVVVLGLFDEKFYNSRLRICTTTHPGFTKDRLAFLRRSVCPQCSRGTPCGLVLKTFTVGRGAVVERVSHAAANGHAGGIAHASIHRRIAIHRYSLLRHRSDMPKQNASLGALLGARLEPWFSASTPPLHHLFVRLMRRVECSPERFFRALHDSLFALRGFLSCFLDFAMNTPEIDEQRERLMQAVGSCIMAWANVELRLATTFERMFGFDIVTSTARIWARVRSFEGKLQILNDVMSERLEKNEIGLRDWAFGLHPHAVIISQAQPSGARHLCCAQQHRSCHRAVLFIDIRYRRPVPAKPAPTRPCPVFEQEFDALVRVLVWFSIVYLEPHPEI